MANDSLAACLAEIKANPDRFYVYVLSRPCGTPFYVGCGRDKRILRHEAEAKTKIKSRKLSIIRKLERDGKRPTYSIDGWFDSWDLSAERERELIKKIGRHDLHAGPLANRTSGGEGAPNISPSGSASLSRIFKEMWKDPAYRHKVSTGILRAYARPDVRQRRSEASKAAWELRRLLNPKKEKPAIDPVVHAKIVNAKRAALSLTRSINVKKRLSDPSFREAFIGAAVKYKKSEQGRAAQSKITKEMWEDLGYRQRVAEGRSKTLARMSETGQHSWRNPEFRIKQADFAKNGWSDPVKRAERCVAIKAAWARRREREAAATVRGKPEIVA